MNGTKKPTATCFNPLPPPKQGETCGVWLRSRRSAMFQSAPPTEAGGDAQCRGRLAGTPSFNPLPPPKQGETHAFGGWPLAPVVSIRSPHRSRGRLRHLQDALPEVVTAPLARTSFSASRGMGFLCLVIVSSLVVRARTAARLRPPARAS